MRVRWTPPAKKDIVEIFDWIANDDVAAAERIVQRLRLAVAALRLSPAQGRAGRLHGTRELVISGTPYLAVYRAQEGSIDILRVVHGARRWPPGESRTDD